MANSTDRKLATDGNGTAIQVASSPVFEAYAITSPATVTTTPTELKFLPEHTELFLKTTESILVSRTSGFESSYSLASTEGELYLPIAEISNLFIKAVSTTATVNFRIHTL